MFLDTKSNLIKADKLSATTPAPMTDIDGNLNASRQYSKPWLAHSKKDKSPVKDKQKHGKKHFIAAIILRKWLFCC